MSDNAHVPGPEHYGARTAETILSEAAATLDLDRINWGTLSRAEAAEIMAKARRRPEAVAKAEKRATELPASAADRRRYRASGGRQTPPPNRNRIERDAFEPIEAALGAVLHADGTLDDLERAEDGAVGVLAWELELPELRDLEVALADRRSARPDLLARERAKADRLAAARAELATEQAVLETMLGEHGYTTSTPAVQIAPLGLRHAAIDAAQRINWATELVNRLMEDGFGSAHVSLEANVRDTRGLLRAIAQRRASAAVQTKGGKR